MKHVLNMKLPEIFLVLFLEQDLVIGLIRKSFLYCMGLAVQNIFDFDPFFNINLNIFYINNRER